MHIRNRFIFAAGLLAGAVALGCQAPTPIQPASRAPRVLTHVGNLGLDADTDLALEFQQPCAGGKAGYELQALDARIARIRVLVKGDNLPAAGLPIDVTRDEFLGDCTLTKQIQNLLPGTYTLTMTGFDAAGNGVMKEKDPATVVITANGTSLVTLQCDFSKGTISLTIDCCSPAPSPTPTPVPTATPTPPTVQFDDRTNEGAYGFTVDTQGRVYVFGWDIPVVTGGGDARIYRFTPGVAVPSPVPYIDNVRYTQEGTIVGGIFTGVTAGVPGGTGGATRMRFDLTAANPTPTYTHLGTSYLVESHRGANALDPVADKAYATYGIYQTNSGYEHTVVYQATPGVELFNTGPLPPQAVSNLPHTMEWAPTLGQPVWASQGGIFKPGANSATAPTRLVQGPAYGLLSLDNGASTGFLTRWGWSLEKTIFHYDLATSDVATAKLTFTHGFPRTIEKGADGNYYVFLSETGYAAPSAGVFYNRLDLGGVGGAAPFRIVKLKWDATTKVLTPDYIVVDNFTNNTASW